LAGPYDPARTEVSSWPGAFSAQVAARPDRIRCRYASGEFSAVGPIASRLIGAETDADVFGPLRALVEEQGAVVLMGIDLTRMTLLHLAEVEAGRRPFIRWARGRDGRVVRVRVGECSEGFESLAPTLAPVERVRRVGVHPAEDKEYRQTYLARVRGEVDDETWFSFVRSRTARTST
jgi:aminoglycoside 3-N-acetyltransferase